MVWAGGENKKLPSRVMATMMRGDGEMIWSGHPDFFWSGVSSRSLRWQHGWACCTNATTVAAPPVTPVKPGPPTPTTGINQTRPCRDAFARVAGRAWIPDALAAADPVRDEGVHEHCAIGVVDLASMTSHRPQSILAVLGRGAHTQWGWHHDDAFVDQKGACAIRTPPVTLQAPA